MANSEQTSETWKPLRHHPQACKTVAGPGIKRCVLKPGHLNAVKEKKNNPDNGNENEKIGMPWKESVPELCREKRILPQGRSAARSFRASDRIKDFRLKGADLYVARLAWKAPPSDTSDSHGTRTQDLKSGADEWSSDDIAGMIAPATAAGLSIRSGSLHDELSNHAPKESTVAAVLSCDDRNSATQSQPCYRCISYMDSAGIRRVFWTNRKGEWEGAKIRDLMDALDAPGVTRDVKGLDKRKAADVAFVTKHEVLRLARSMGL